MSLISGGVSDRDLDASGADDFYPDRLFSMGDYYMPDNIKNIFRFCKYLVLSDPIVSGSIHKMAEAPVTQIDYEHSNEEVKQRYQTLMEQKLGIREKLLEAGFDLATYSNAFLSLEVPVQRYLISPNVADDQSTNEFKKHAEQARNGDMPKTAFDMKYSDEIGTNGGRLPNRFRAENINWTLTGDGRFKGPCPITGKQVIFERQDRYYPSADNLRIKKWDPNRIEIHHNEVTGENEYYYKMKHSTVELIKDGDERHYNNDPWEYIQAARNNRNVKIKKDQLLHLSNVKISGAFNGWGIPRLYSAFKLIFYYMTLLRSNEQVARGKISDLNILFPQSQSGMLDPVAAMPGSSFKRNVKSILENWREDRNFVGVSPIPVGNLSVFGQGRMQLVSSELQPIMRMITTALGIPYDILFGGGKYSGMAVQQRLFSAQTGLHKKRFDEALDFFQHKIVSLLGADQYPQSLNMKLKDYEGPDDVKKKQTRAQAAMNQMMSLSTFWEDQDLDPEAEWQKMEEDAKKMSQIRQIRAEGQARAKAEGQEIMQRSKIDLKEELADRQKAIQQNMAMAGSEAAQKKKKSKSQAQKGMTKKKMKIAKQMLRYAKENDAAQKVLQFAKAKYPNIYKLLRQKLAGGQAPDADMPSLEDRPPRRKGSSGVKLGPQRDSGRTTAGQQNKGFEMMDSGAPNLQRGGQMPQPDDDPEQKPPRSL